MAAKKNQGIVKKVEVDAHKAAKGVRNVNSAVNAGEVIASGDPQRIERWMIRKGSAMIFQRITNKLTAIPGKLAGKGKRKK